MCVIIIKRSSNKNDENELFNVRLIHLKNVVADNWSLHLFNKLYSTIEFGKLTMF